MSKQWISALTAGVLLASAGAVSAEEEKGFYIGGKAAYTEVFDADGTLTTEAAAPGDPLTQLLTDLGLLPPPVGASIEVDTEYDDDWGYGVNFGYKTAGALRLELEYSEGENDVSNSDSALEVQSLLGNVWYDFRAGERLRPYVGFGLGMANMELNGSDDDVFMGQLGAGVNYHLTPRLVMDAGYRYAVSEDPEFASSGSKLETEYEAQSLMIGLRYNFFDAQYGAKDGDGDGVVDETDQCPGTPRGVQVDSVGCPLDGDNDGVADYLDKCPNTPAGEQVDAQGCSLDSDGDGVADRDDACPNTPAGEQVMSNGCGQEQSVVLRGVNFEVNSAQLTVNAETILDGVASTLNSSPGFNVELQGHTDSSGSDSYNMNLSQNRAKSVKNYLVGQGVDGSRLTARGYGEEQPIASNDTKDGRAENRRVELKVLGDEEMVVEPAYVPTVEEEPMVEEAAAEAPAEDAAMDEDIYDYDPSADVQEEEYDYDYDYDAEEEL